MEKINSVTDVGDTAMNAVDSETHVWLAEFSGVENIDSYRAVLSSDEFDILRQECGSFNTGLSLFCRALMRKTLSQYIDLPPNQWKFSRGEYGKPEVVNFDLPFFFNASHSSQFAVCAIGQAGPIGVDIERSDRVCSTDKIAHRFFTKSEAETFSHLTARRRRKMFFELWTLKEAYLKARGIGLRQALNTMSFSKKLDGTITIDLVENFEDDPACWSFSLLEPSLNYQLAVAVRMPVPSARLNIKLFRHE